MGVFYFMPTQGNEAIHHYLAHNILRDSLKVSDKEISQKINNDLNVWMNENGIQKIIRNKDRLKIFENNSIERDRLKIMKFKRDYTIDLIKENPISFFKIITWKSLQTLILDPVYIFHYHYYEQDLTKRPQWYLEKSYYNFWMPIKIIYSMLIYIIIFIGFLRSLKSLDIAFNFLIIISSLYMFGMLGWVGTSRYFSPSLIYLSIYFGYGLNYLLRLNTIRTIFNK